jgi:hypothetical protein
MIEGIYNSTTGSRAREKYPNDELKGIGGSIPEEE